MSNPFYYAKTAAGTLAHLALALGWVGSLLVPWVCRHTYSAIYVSLTFNVKVNRKVNLSWLGFLASFQNEPKKNSRIVFKCRNSWDGSGTSGVPLIRKIQSIEGNMVTVALNLYTKRNIHTNIHITREAGRSLLVCVCVQARVVDAFLFSDQMCAQTLLISGMAFDTTPSSALRRQQRATSSS